MQRALGVVYLPWDETRARSAPPAPDPPSEPAPAPPAARMPRCWPAALLAALAALASPAAARRLRIGAWHLDLRENSAIRSPYYDECRFYKGAVVGESDSSATVTECGGALYGLLQVGGEDFVLQPGGETHVLRRRDALLQERPAYDLTGDTVADLDLDLGDDEIVPVPYVRPLHSGGHHELDYLRSDGPITRPMSGSLVK